MDAFLWRGELAATPIAYKRSELAKTAGAPEKWLQAQIFAHPNLLPLSEIDSDAATFVPICAEFTVPSGRSGRIDILGVTAGGRLVIVECKLWRNPQARREVVGQIFEYAALLRKQSYADLQGRLREKLGCSGENTLFEKVKAKHPAVDEATFTDAVSRSLMHGDFLLIIAGDGIRSNLDTVSDMLRTGRGGFARLALVEIRLCRGDDGSCLAVPSMAFRTEVTQQRVLVTSDGKPIEFAEESAAGEVVDDIPPDEVKDRLRADRRKTNREFWDRFIGAARFDHPDQTKPRHGSNNTVRMNLPSPANWLTAYRISEGRPRVGVFFRLTGPGGADVHATLREEADSLRAETGLPLEFGAQDDEIPWIGAVSEMNVSDSSTEDEQLAWLLKAANAMVSVFRPQLAQHH